jgi:hypothetical protein
VSSPSSPLTKENTSLKGTSMADNRLREMEVNPNIQIHPAAYMSVQLLSTTFREANFCADFIAKLATSCDNGLMIWDEPPQGLQQLLLADIRISFPRVV